MNFISSEVALDCIHFTTLRQIMWLTKKKFMIVQN